MTETDRKLTRNDGNRQKIDKKLWEPATLKLKNWRNDRKWRQIDQFNSPYSGASVMGNWNRSQKTTVSCETPSSCCESTELVGDEQVGGGLADVLGDDVVVVVVVVLVLGANTSIAESSTSLISRVSWIFLLMFSLCVGSSSHIVWNSSYRFCTCWGEDWEVYTVVWVRGVLNPHFCRIYWPIFQKLVGFLSYFNNFVFFWFLRSELYNNTPQTLLVKLGFQGYFRNIVIFTTVEENLN